MTKIFDIVPGWLWAIAVAVLLALLGVDTVRIANGKANLATLNAAVAEQKAKASAELAAVTASVLAQQKTIDSLHDKQEQADASNVQIVAGLQGSLHDALAAHGSRLCNPAPGRRVSGGGAASPVAANASPGAADPAQAGGVLQPDAQGLLEQLMREADAVNIAYRSCRADAQTVRGHAAPTDYSLPTGKRLPAN